MYFNNKNDIISSYDYFIKIIIVGESGCGKSKFLISFCYDSYIEDYLIPINEEFDKRLYINDKTFKLNIYDLPKKENYQNQFVSWGGSRIVILFYDITNLKSFNSCKNKWIGDIKRKCNNDVILALVGTKLDETEIDSSKRQVTNEMIDQFIKENNINHHFQVSSKYKYNIDECIYKTVNDAYLILVNEEILLKKERDKYKNENNNCIIN